MKAIMPILEGPPGASARIDGRDYVYFAGTGYLGLQGHADVIRAACEATQRFGIHSATTRAGFGNTPPTLLAERRAAEFFGTADAFYFVSGYAGNSILLQAIEGGFDALFIDELSHYSVLEATRLTRCPVFRFRHRDAGDLVGSLRKNLRPGQRPLVMSDGVFSVRGTIAPAAEYRAALGGYAGAGLLLDDAHGVGVLGANGRGTLEHFGLFDGRVNGDTPAVERNSFRSALVKRNSFRSMGTERNEFRATSTAEGGCATFFCATASKALGGFGGIVPGSQAFIERVRGASHWYDGASAPPAAAPAATARAIELIMADPGLKTRLWSNVRLLKDGLRAMGFDVDDTPVPIVCLVAGGAENMRRIQQELMRRGIAVAYMAAYSGLGPEGGLRIAVFATHTEAMIGQLLDELRRLV
jgi:8-amino-7-oxononanoate synthase